VRKSVRYEAHLDDYGLITIYLSRQFYNGKSDVFYLKKPDGTLHKCPILNFELSQGDYNKYIIQTHEPIEIGQPYEVTEEHGLKVPLQYSLITKTSRFDHEFYYDGDDLGVHPSDEGTVFALWAPTAARVILEMVDSPKKSFEMARSEKGVYRFTVRGNAHGRQYLYHVFVNGHWNTTSDPIARSATSNNSASVVIDYTRLDVERFNHRLPVFNSPTEAVIYELSIRDFTNQLESGVKARSQFLGLTELGTKTPNGISTGLSHIVELGVTHVQIMPMYDFSTVDEDNPSTFYNWGYDPLQYNVPEGSFSSNPKDPLKRVYEARAMVQAFHKQGIRVIMDVVYNHVYEMDSNAFEKVVPYYYFRRSTSGALSNGSFCNNDVDSNRLMVRKFILDSVKCWMEAYDVDGFRFDLMGVLDVETMNAVEAQCKALKPDSMVYGEGWNMPTILPEDMKANMGNQAKMPHIAHFNDFFREHAKGRTSPDEITMKGYCSGDTSFYDAMTSCMVGTCLPGMVKIFDQPTQSVNYVECHDNHTSWDKLKECCKEDAREIRIKKHKLMIGALLLAQGIPFLHSGQEFCRTKNGQHNSYRSSDAINQVDWLRKERHLEVVQYTKDMIALRKRLPVFRMSSASQIQNRVSFRNFDGMLVMHYVCERKNPYHELWVYINPTNQIYYERFEDFVEILANEAGLIEGVKAQNVTVNPYTLVVFAKK
jgi:pullulanase